jgi:uncharacterized protein with NAD-binding domain and iron-sulfur cluster
MAGLAAAWRLSESGWEAEYESITVYQRGWRLGGKGASSRGENGRIEEHGLHVWFGWYENAFQLLRECYEVLDRSANDPLCPVRTVDDAMVAAGTVGLAEDQHGVMRHWAIEMPANSRSSTGSARAGRELTAVDFSMQAMTLISHYFDALAGEGGSSGFGGAGALAAGLAVSSTALIAEAARLADRQRSLHHTVLSGAGPGMTAVGALLGAPEQSEPALHRTWQGIALMTAAVRGILSDGLLTAPHGLEAINDEEYLDWIGRHGGPSELRDFSVVRGLYDLAFGYADGDPSRPSMSAGTGVLFGGKSLLDYKDSFIWKMTAGMGDIVFAPLYQALRRRGVEFEFFHRVDQLHPSADGNRIDSITVGRQARLKPGRSHYEPLVSCRGLPVFPSRPLVDQLSDAEGIERQPLESHWCEWRDAEKRVLQRGVDFDLAVFAIPPGMA